jgi:hypothetical protein
MTNEPTQTPYTDALVTSMAEDHAILVSNFPEASTTDYDLHAIAAEIWEEKAASLAPEVTNGISNEFGETSDKFVNQSYEHALKQIAYHFAHRKPRSRKPVKFPRERTVDVGL